MAYVLAAREHCTPSDCAAFQALTDSHQIAANMDEKAYETLIVRYTSTWNAPPPAPTGAVAALIPGVPTGRPTNAEFPTAASTPPVSIMTPEPGTSTAPAPRAAATANSTPSPHPASASSLAAAKKPPTPKPPRAQAAAPVSIAPAAAPAPAASND
jgi:hypothetical protein